MKHKNIILFSGGIDSFIAHEYLESTGMDITPVYIHYGGKYCDKEMNVVKSLLPNTQVHEGVFNFKDMEHGENAFISFRNLYLTTFASSLSNNIFIGGLKDDNVGDKSPLFFIKLSEAISEAKGEEVMITSPFWLKEKVEIVEWYTGHVGNSVASRMLGNTTSCYHPRVRYCGECPSCFRKYCALVSNGFNLKFHNFDLAKRYVERAIAGEFTEKRTESILYSVNKLRIANTGPETE